MSLLSRRGIVLLGAFCMLPLLNFPRALISDRTLFLRDVGMVWAPQVEAVVQQIGQGHMPYFDARRAFGQPLFADPRSEVLYPLAWIHWILPLERSYSIFCAIHLVIAALGAARLAHRLVEGASVADLAAAGLVFAAGGPLLSLASHWHHLAGAAWMPWILERADAGMDGRTPWISLSMLMALQIFAGSPDYTFLTFFLCLVRLLTRTDRPAGARARVLGALCLGVLIGAAQLLPTLAFARGAARDPHPVGWALAPLHPALTLETAVPIRAEAWPLRPEMRSELLYNNQVWMFSHYLGLSAWALAALGFWRARRTTRGFALSCLALGVFLSWGVRGDSLQRLVAHVPLVADLRFPTKHLAASSLGLSVLAAAAGTGAPWSRREGKRILLGAILAMAACAALFLGATERAAAFQPIILARPLVAAGALLGLFLVDGKSRQGWLVPLLVAIDLLGANISLNPTTPSSVFRNRPPLTEVIPPGSRIYVSDYSVQLRRAQIRPSAGDSPYRLAKVPTGYGHAESLLLAATWYLHPPSASRFGYYGSFDLDVLDFYREPLKKTIETFVTSRDPQLVVDRLRRGSVGYVVTMDPEALWASLPLVVEERRFFEAPVRVYRVPGAWPRVRMETEDGSRLESSPRVLEARDGRMRIDSTAPDASRLVVATAYDQGWRATVDGVETPVGENAMAFISIPLTAGHHTVDVFYRPPWLRTGTGLSVIGLIIACGLGARTRRGRFDEGALRSDAGLRFPCGHEGEEQEERSQSRDADPDHGGAR